MTGNLSLEALSPRSSHRLRPVGSLRPAIRVVVGVSLAVAFFAGFSRGDEASASRRAASTFPVVAYVPDYRVDSIDPSVGGLVTDLIFFSIEPKPTGELDTSRLTPRAIEKLRAIKATHGNRLLVAIGGWDRSKGFARVAGDAKTRGRFASELTRFCLDRKFDGADFDWEHPANQAEEDSYAALLEEVKRAFGPKRLLLTLTMADWQNPGPKAYAAVDRVQIMSYDHQGARHSTFEQAKADIATFVARGVPKSKICLGLPFYGRSLKDPNVVKTYAEIVNAFKPAPDVDEAGGFWFNNVGTIRRKTRYVRENGFGGVMVWEVGQDAVGETSLLKAIHRAAVE